MQDCPYRSSNVCV
ncbi:hypothetical protein C5167_034929 [Papaver somniferum]|uniref:Uncharacterized protein n=1 Tax=Papaver somniferum TaxID=3469 RepID=A0A4Y7KIH9_PAPSO|nr:hypothetical protein C5167_034929 [Papaver somniferum]